MSSTREHPTAGVAGRPQRRWAFLARPGWIAAILAACAFAGACFFLLAPWQFNRHAERSTQNTAVDAALVAPAVPATDLLSTSAQPSQDALWRVATATGRFDPSRQVQVRLRQDANGQPVSEVIAPFTLDSGETLLVDRGYVSFADVRSGAPIPALPTGQVSISGRVQAEQTDPKDRQPLVVGDHIEAYAINIAAVSSPLTGGIDSDESYLLGYLQLTAGSPAVLIPIDLPQTDDGPFLSYALQWEAFGVIALIGMGVFIFRKAFAPRPPDDRDRDGDGNGGGGNGGGGNGGGGNQDSAYPARPTRPALPTRAAADPAPAVHPAPPARMPDPAPVAAGRERPGRERHRASRDGFDKSQLYDD